MMANGRTSHATRIVAISRQRGSGGSFIGRAIAERLGFRYVDREMLRHATEFLSAHEREKTHDPGGTGRTSWWSRVAGAFAFGGPDCHYAPPSSDVEYEGELFEVQHRLLREIVDDHAAVIVGRGAAQTLGGRPEVLSVFLHAPEPWRIERVQRVYGIADVRAAQRLVRDSDRNRARFIESVAGFDWTDRRRYDLTVDVADTGLDTAIDLVVREVNARATGVPVRADIA